jgi:hypothetical protein
MPQETEGEGWEWLEIRKKEDKGQEQQGGAELISKRVAFLILKEP